MASQQVVIPARFRGPPKSANGGYAAGILADAVSGPCEVTLRAPPPLDAALELSSTDAGAVLRQDGTLIAEAVPRPFELELPAPVSFEEAEVASRAYSGWTSHPFPTCFVCGPARPRGDGLAIWPGPVEGRRIVAAPFVPTADLCRDGVLESRFVWAALDCPSWFGFVSFATDLPSVLLGRLTLDLRGRPHRDERCVVVGWSLGREGRRIECASMLLGASGEVLAHGKSTWVALKHDGPRSATRARD